MHQDIEQGVIVRLHSGQVCLVITHRTFAGLGVFYEVLTNDGTKLLIDQTEISEVL